MRKPLWWADDPGEKKYLLDRNGFLDALVAWSPPALLNRDALDRIVGGAERSGHPVSAKGTGQPLYHKNFSWNCLYHSVPEYQQAYRSSYSALRGLIGLSEDSRGGRCCPEGAQAEAPTRVLCLSRGLRWTVEVRVESVKPFENEFVRASFPLPSAISSQTDIRVLGAWAGSREIELKPIKRYLRMPGVFIQSLVDEKGALSIRYEVALSRSETHAHGFRTPEVPEDELKLPIENFLEVVRGRTTGEWPRAAHLYQWMIANSKILRGKVGCACYKCAPKKFLFRGGGTQYLLSKTFNAFARQLGIQTRMAYGSLPASIDPHNPSCQVAPIQSNSVFSHFWSEFEVPGVGWLPVDFLPSSFSGPESRPEDRFLRQFYFGNSDSLRIQVSPRLKGIPILEHSTRTGPKAPWKAVSPKWVVGTSKIEPWTT